jgi:hypothetical protein
MSTDPTRSDAMNHKSKLVTNHFDRQLECSCGFRTRIADGFALSIFDIEDEFRAHLPAPVADAAPANLHQQIMNIPADKRPVGGSRACDEAYLFGHRDARHAAAELASAAVADAAPASEDHEELRAEATGWKREADRLLQLCQKQSREIEDLTPYIDLFRRLDRKFGCGHTDHGAEDCEALLRHVDELFDRPDAAPASEARIAEAVRWCETADDDCQCGECKAKRELRAILTGRAAKASDPVDEGEAAYEEHTRVSTRDLK